MIPLLLLPLGRWAAFQLHITPKHSTRLREQLACRWREVSRVKCPKWDTCSIHDGAGGSDIFFGLKIYPLGILGGQERCHIFLGLKVF